MQSVSIDVRNVSHRYAPRHRGEAAVLANDDVSLTVGRGEIVGLFGANGAGKSTLMHQIMGLLRPSSGQIRVHGVDVVATPDAAKELVGFMPQSQFAMRSLEVRRALAYTGCLRGQPHSDALAQADELIDRLDLRADRHRYVDSLSGGLKRLVTFAMALMGRPPVLVLDEPTNELDPRRRRLVWDLTCDLNRRDGVTCVLVTHNLVEAERVLHRAAVMHRARVVASGTPAELKRAFGATVRLSVFFREGHVPTEPELASLRALGPTSSSEPQRLDVVFPAMALAAAAGPLTVLDARGDLEHFHIAPPSLEDVYLDLDARLGRGEELAPRRAPDPALRSAPPPDRRGPGFLRALRYLLLEQLCEVRHTWAYSAIVAVLMPVAMVFGMTRIGSGISDARSLLYIVTGSAVFGGVTEGIASLAQKMGMLKREGLLAYYASLPISKVAFVLSVVLARLTVLLPGMAAPAVAARLMYSADVHFGPWVLVILVLTSLSLASVGMAVGSLVKGVQAIETLTNLLVFVVLLGAPVFIPVEALPPPLRVLGYLLPPTYAASALRSALAHRVDARFFVDLGALGAATALSLLALHRWIRWGV